MPPLRTPPKSPKATHKKVQSHSGDSENAVNISTAEPKGNITTRTKRQRIDDSPKTPMPQTSCECNVLKTELMELLATWKSDQDIRFSTWKTDQDAMLSSLIKDVSELKTQCIEIRKITTELENSLTYMHKDYDDMKARVSALDKWALDKDETVQHLEKQIQELSLQSRSSTIELRNVPTKEQEKVDDLVAIVSQVGKAVDLNICKSSLRDIYRLPGKPGSSRSIVAEFNSVSCRNDFLASVRRFNKDRTLNEKLNTHTIGLPGEKKPIYAAEHLTPSMRKLFYEARQLAKTYKLFCWCLNGKIFLKKNQDDKPTQITSDRSLSEFIKKC